MAAQAAARAELDRLRRQIARLEGKPEESARLEPLAGGYQAHSSSERLAAAGEQVPPPRSGGGGPPKAVEGADDGRRPTIRPLHHAAHGPLSPATRGRITAPPAPSSRSPGGEGAARLAFGVPRLDAALGGGLVRGALHEIRTAESRDGAAACGFALAALAAFAADAGRPPAILWIAEAAGRREAGELYRPGLEALGLDPAWVVRVAVRRPAEALWALEAGLASGGLAFAVCELGRAGLGLTASRRAALRARASGATGLVLRLGSAAEPSAAETRLLLAPASSRPEGAFAGGLGRPAWRLAIEKSRGIPPGAFTVEWDPDARRFSERGEAGRRGAEPHPLPVAAAPCDRPAAPGWKRAG